jgi:hypothetical protein
VIGGARGTCGEWRNKYRVVVRKPDVERPLGRPRRRWVYNIKVNFKELGCEGMDWFNMAHDMAKWHSLAGEFRDSMKNV